MTPPRPPPRPKASNPLSVEGRSEPVADAPESAVDEPPPGPERTVTRKGAAVGMALALLAGGLLGWLGAGAFDDDDTRPVSAFQRGRFGEGRGPGGRFPGGGFPGHGFPGGEHGPADGRGDQWDGQGGRPTPPWMHDDGRGGYQEGDADEDRQDQDRQDQDRQDEDRQDEDRQDEDRQDQDRQDQDQSDDA